MGARLAGLPEPRVAEVILVPLTPVESPAFREAGLGSRDLDAMEYRL